MSYNKVTEAPEDLRKLIDAFNAWPKFGKKGFERVQALVNQFNADLLAAYGAGGQKAAQKIQDRYTRLITDSIPPEIRAAFRLPGVFNAWMELQRLKVERLVLIDVVNAFNQFHDQDFHLEHGQQYPYRFRENGSITSASRVLDLFGVMSPERVRICLICGTIFWAKKSNAQTCSPACATKLGNLKRLKKDPKSRAKARVKEIVDRFNAGGDDFKEQEDGSWTMIR
jgi:hypothetical protein